MSETSPSNVVNGHELRGIERGPSTPYGPGSFKRWVCLGCGIQTGDKEGLGECPDPTEWVERGTPGDGLGWCPDCNSVFPIDYDKMAKTHGGIGLAPCPRCGGEKWERSDDVRPENPDN